MLAGSTSYINIIPDEILAAAARGWKVFPIAASTKNGALVKWGTEASNDLDQIAAWSRQFPGSNWGVATGEKSGFFGIDMDSAEGLMWAASNNLPMGGYQVKTGKADPFANHLYFRQPAGVRIKTDTKIAPGVDVRGDGGMLVLPPSIHPSGNRYSILCDAEVAEPPEWLLQLVKDTRPERPLLALEDLPPLTPNQIEFGRNIFLKKCREFSELPAGTGIRNGELNKLGFLAGGLIGSGAIDLEFAEEAMREYAAAYIVEESERPAMATWRSGLEAGMGSPVVPEAPAVEDAGFGQAPLPPGASLEPVVGGGPKLALSRDDRALYQVGTQDAVARVFRQKMTGVFRYDHTAGKWLEWDGTRWLVDETRKVYNCIRDTCVDENQKNGQQKASMATATFFAGVETLLKADPALASKSSQFDRDSYLLNSPAGTIDLRTGELRAHDSNDLLTRCTSVAPSADGGEEFLRFLSQIMLGDASLVEFLQVALGACLSGAIENHWLMFWIGEGRNGKNTLGDLIQDAMGDYAKKIPASTLMSKSFESHPTEVANLKGVRLATSSEVNDGDHWDEARINEVTGDATLSGRVMRGDFFTFQRTHKHLIYGNYSPQLRSVSKAIRERLKIVPFKASFAGHEDTGLPSRLRVNLGYVLHWLIEGHQKWMENSKKLAACAAVEAETAQYFEQQATPQLWLSERCELVPADGRPAPQLPRVADLYRDYREWKERRGEVPVSQKRWTDAAMRGFEKAKGMAGWHYRGLMLRPRVDGMPFSTGVPYPPPAKAVVQ